MTRLYGLALPIVFAAYAPFCTPSVHPTAPRDVAQREMAEFWREPTNVPSADLVYGPWGKEYAPDPRATYTFERLKKNGVSPGMTLADPEGQEWSVKQGPEGQVEVVTSRVLSALGYHQPPAYFLATVAVHENGTTRVTAGGRFRPKLKGFKDKGEWSWQQNPFVGTQPYQGLLALLMLMNSTDLKNDNNSLYELKDPREGATRWYVVRDLGSGLGQTGRMNPKRNDPAIFERERFITGVHDGFVGFNYHGYHQELVWKRLSPIDVRWACDLAARLTDQQWRELFRSAGYDDESAGRFIAALEKRIAEGRALR